MQRLKGMLRSLSSGSSRGFTLPEILVSLGLLGMTMGLLGGGLFQALGIQRYWTDDVIARRDVRHAISWFSRAALDAQTTDLVDGAPPVSSVTINWTGKDLVPHTMTYAISGTDLTRNYDGNVLTVARNVVSLAFSRSGQTINFGLTVTASRNGTETKSLSTYARMLQ